MFVCYLGGMHGNRRLVRGVIATILEQVVEVLKLFDFNSLASESCLNVLLLQVYTTSVKLQIHQL